MLPLCGLGRVGAAPTRACEANGVRRRERRGLSPKPSGSGVGGKSRHSGMREVSPIWAETRDVALARTRRRAGLKKSRRKT